MLLLTSLMLLWSSQAVFASPMQDRALPGELHIGRRAVPPADPIPPEAYATAMPGLSPVADYTQLKYLEPNMTNEMWYYAMDHGRPSAIRMKYHNKYPAVPLDQSTWIANVSCTGRTIITGTFTKPVAFDHAQAQWSNKKNVIFATAASTCSSDGQNAWFHVNSVVFHFPTQSFEANCVPGNMEDICENMDIDFGPNMNMQGAGMTPMGTAQASATTTSTYGPTILAAPSPTINGMPAVAAGSGFDQRMDDRLGYYHDDTPDEAVSESTFKKKFPNMAKSVFAAASGMKSTRRALSKRFSLSGFVNSVVSTVSDTVSAVGQAVTSTLQTVVNAASTVVNVAVGVGSALVQFVATGQYSNSQTFTIDLSPDSLDQNTPFGEAYTVFVATADPGEASADITTAEKFGQLIGNVDKEEPQIGAYCIDCGITGQIGVTGSISASISSGVTQCMVAAGANFHAGATFGINAFTMKNFTKTIPLVTKPLSHWKIPGIVTFGPQFVLALENSLTLSALGQLRSGLTFTWPNAQAVLDLKTPANSHQSGWTPQISLETVAAGELKAVAALGLPVSLQFAITLLDKYTAAVSLTDTPAISATASAMFSLNLDGSCSLNGGSCRGITYAVDVENSLDFEIKGLYKNNLAMYTGPTFAQGCIPVPLPGNCRRKRDELFVPEIDMSPLEQPRVYGKSMSRRALREETRPKRQESMDNTRPANFMDPTGQISIYASWDGNLFVGPANATNLTMMTGDSRLMTMESKGNHVLYGDNNQRVLHYFPETMDKMGISRLRIAAWMDLPKGSRLVTLVPITSNGNTMLLGVDASGAHFFLFTCQIDGTANKLFLVNDHETWATALRSYNARFMITGGRATHCVPLHMTM